ncbi:Nuclear envelope morphology protein 1 [Paramarasmius palmivorus]|uniref:Mitochondrial import inner membrane translocase subunit TIM50 n=1 Tax=Paramarasmius palmivorus TaxID=297713 RepID=A0AAW0DB05_9AGAR
MNSLAYLSRQFDVLASPKTPPSTPSSEHPPELPLKRVRTWSTRSFLISPEPARSPSQRRSSISSTFETRSRPPPLSLSASQKTSSSISVEATIISKSHEDSLISRIYIVRILTWAWETLRRAWSSFIEGCFPARRDGATWRTETEMVLEESSHETSSSSSSSSTAITTIYTHSPPTADSSPLVTRVKDQSLILNPSSPNDLYPPSRATDSSSSTPRSTTPVLSTRKTPFHAQKTLVLDLDETLIHSTSRPIPHAGNSGFFGLSVFGNRKPGPGHVVEVMLGGRSTVYHVYKRPFVDFFLRTVSGWYTLVIFTASMREYADPVIDWLDAGRGILGNRLFRDILSALTSPPVMYATAKWIVYEGSFNN